MKAQDRLALDVMKTKFTSTNIGAAGLGETTVSAKTSSYTNKETINREPKTFMKVFIPFRAVRAAFEYRHWLTSTCWGVPVSLALSLLACQSNAQVTLINFDNVPSAGTPVDSFGNLFPGITLVSSNQWFADQVNNSVFTYIRNGTISTFDGAPLQIGFDSPAQNVTMDFGSGQIGVSLTIGVTGYRAGHLVFTDSFATSPGPFGGDEVRAYTFGTVDELVVAKTSGNTLLTMDNLSFVTVPEPAPVALIGAGGLALSLSSNRLRRCRAGAGQQRQFLRRD